jgi:catechol 2,3-dioxygenase-like lactoylglutathione lyase family enzyme
MFAVADSETTPRLVGIHHVTLPVVDVEGTAEWFARVLGFEACIEFEDEDSVTGALLEHPSGAALRLRADPAHAMALAHYPAFCLAVAGRGELVRWDEHLTRLGVTHTGVTPVHEGWEIALRGPGLIRLCLTTAGPLDGVADEPELTA